MPDKKHTIVMSPLADPVVAAIFANERVAGLAAESIIRSVLSTDNLLTIIVINILSLYNVQGVNFMQAIKAIYDGVSFMPKQPIPYKGKFEVVITFIEPINEDVDNYLCCLLEPDTNKTPVLGRMNGLIEIPNDFDEPLDEMKEYMY